MTTTTLDIEAAKARQAEIEAARKTLDEEWHELRYAIQREDDRPLIGRYFKRHGISSPEDDPRDDGWIVWTRVDEWDDSGAWGVEYRYADGEWYDVKLREHVRRDDVGTEVTRDEFMAAIQPLLDHLSSAPREGARDAGRE